MNKRLIKATKNLENATNKSTDITNRLEIALFEKIDIIKEIISKLESCLKEHPESKEKLTVSIKYYLAEQNDIEKEIANLR